MFSKFISIGDRVELQPLFRGGLAQEGNSGRVYHSTVQDILSEDTIEVKMPMEKSKLILLPVDAEFDMVFYGASGLYQCLARITDRYKSNNVYLLQMELTSNLRKYQRREFYRLKCALEMYSRTLDENELKLIEGRLPYTLTKGLPLKKSVVVDISGGGLRFLSVDRYEPGSMLYCSYHLTNGSEHKKFDVICKVISSVELENRPGTYEHRVQYFDLDPEVREEIIKYIFEEERRNRQKKKFGTENK